MDVRATQSLFASMQLTGKLTRYQLGPAEVDSDKGAAATASLDVVEISLQVDATFVMNVVQKSLGERLQEALDSAGVDMSTLMESGELGTSPAATARRIADFSLSFFAAYRLNHADQSDADARTSFASLINRALDEGFAGARDLLEGFSEMTDSLWATIDETHGLAMSAVDDFAAQRIGEADTAGPTATAI